MIGLGLDAGGTSTRWAVANGGGRVLADGEVGTLSGLMLSSSDGREQFASVLKSIATALPRAEPVAAVLFGLTGAGAGSNAALAASMTAQAFGLNPDAIHLRSDMALVHQVHFPSGAGLGHVLYAGTGSYASHLDHAGRLHRVGGRGALLDDAGGGFWIGCEALRAVWRQEESGESLPRTQLADAIFEQIGSDDWAATRALVYGQELANARGGVAKLTLAVAQTQNSDVMSAQILTRAGQELARLVNASFRSHGLRPLALAGRVLTELPRVQSACLARIREVHPGADVLCAMPLNLAQAAAKLAACGMISPVLEP